MKPERTFRTEAIILNRQDFGEADRLLTLFTPRHGKLRAIAKGARKPTTRKSGHVALFARTDMLLHRGRDLMIISQAEMVEGYQPLREDLNRTAYTNYIVELLDRFTTDEDGAESAVLFALLDATLRQLCADADLRLVARYYEMRLLDLVGFRPELTHCVLNGEPITAQDQYFSAGQGGVVCPDCGEAAGNLPTIGMKTLHVLRVLQREPWRRIAALDLPGPVHAEMERVMLGYLVHLLEKRLQSVAFIRRLRAGA